MRSCPSFLNSKKLWKIQEKPQKLAEISKNKKKSTGIS
jgi:hypothetical protein